MFRPSLSKRCIDPKGAKNKFFFQNKKCYVFFLVFMIYNLSAREWKMEYTTGSRATHVKLWYRGARLCILIFSHIILYSFSIVGSVMFTHHLLGSITADFS